MRLIDADALIQDMNEKGISFNADVNEAILNARTIGNYAEYVDRVWELAYERGKEEAQQWIPCSERLPDEKGEYLVAYHPCYWDDVKAEVKVGIDSFRGKTSWAKRKYQRVIAWMPLPKYESEEER